MADQQAGCSPLRAAHNLIWQWSAHPTTLFVLQTTFLSTKPIPIPLFFLPHSQNQFTRPTSLWCSKMHWHNILLLFCLCSPLKGNNRREMNAVSLKRLNGGVRRSLQTLQRAWNPSGRHGERQPVVRTRSQKLKELGYKRDKAQVTRKQTRGKINKKKRKESKKTPDLHLNGKTDNLL